MPSKTPACIGSSLAPCAYAVDPNGTGRRPRVRKENLAQDRICDRHRPALTASFLDRSLEATIASTTKKMAMNETRLLASRRLSRRLPSGSDPAWHSPDTGVAWNLRRGSAVKLKPGERAMKLRHE